MTFVYAIIGVIVIVEIALLVGSYVSSARGECSRRYEEILLDENDLEKHAQEISKSCKVKKCGNVMKCPPAVHLGYRLLLKNYHLLHHYAQKGNELRPAGQEILNNFHLLEAKHNQLRMVPLAKLFRQLPGLQNDGYRGMPRVYYLAWELIGHTHGKVSAVAFEKFMQAYQQDSPLTMQELWCMSDMLRLALLRSVTQIANDTVYAQRITMKAQHLARKIEENTKLIYQINWLKWQNNAEFALLISQVIQYLREQDANEAVSQLQAFLQDRGIAHEVLASLEHRRMAHEQVVVGNAIYTLKQLETVDFEKIFERLSLVEVMLKNDPAGVYPQMDDESRARYRNLVAVIAKKLNVPQTLVARKAIECAQSMYSSKMDEEKVSHVGYYLLTNDGLNRLKSRLHENYKVRKEKSLRVGIYLGSILLLAVIVCAALVVINFYIGSNTFINQWPVLFCLIPAIQIAKNWVNYFGTKIKKPSFIPRIDYEKLPDKCRSVVVVPALLISVERTRELIKQLEVQYLGNRDRELLYILLGDLKDAKEEVCTEDDAILSVAQNEIEVLNNKYKNLDDKPHFYVMWRDRRFNEKQKMWMGYERKRGALMMLNHALQGTELPELHVHPKKMPQRIAYVITVDADTLLPCETALKLIGAMSHPLNKAKLDEEGRRVVDGYALLQPAVQSTLSTSRATLFARVFSGKGGFDQYDGLKPEIYQDLFGEAIYTGKGIYDPHLAVKLLENAIPDNTVLSHDLLEGCYLRTGYVSDIVLYDAYPKGFFPYLMRQHRWIRGDWQLLPWLSKKVRGKDGQTQANPLNLISKWKIVDNFLRSLQAPMILVLIIIGLLSSSPFVWLGFAVVFLAQGLLRQLLYGIRIVFSRDFCISQLFDWIMECGKQFLHALFIFAMLPKEAMSNLHAALITLYRVFVSQKNMLQWVTAADAERAFKGSLFQHIFRMKTNVFFALGILLLTWWLLPQHMMIGIIIGSLWFIAPIWANFFMLPIRRKVKELTYEQKLDMLKLMRQTYGYFEDFVTDKENALPPDNYQEEPFRGLTHRTSPTNIGFALLADLMALDVGYMTYFQFSQRVEKTLQSIVKMDKWHGHLFNWYETTTLKTCKPKYISTVDSGNLVASLMLLEKGLQENLTESPNLQYRANSLLTLILLTKENTVLDTDIKRLAEAQINIESFMNEGCKPIAWVKLLHQLAQELPALGGSWLMKTQEFLKGFTLECDMIYPFLWVEDIKSMETVQNAETWRQLQLPSMNDLCSLAQNGDPILFEAGQQALQIVAKNNELMDICKTLYTQMDFRHLYDNDRNLFAIGYNAEANQLSDCYYDLLASEARLTSLICIALSQIPIKHWKALGRPLRQFGLSRALVSWNGTMFEYLMPLLFMRDESGSLLDESYRTIFAEQQKYGRKFNIPWGVSESGYYALDLDFHYQYSAFGVPEIGLKGGLCKDCVIAPYASVLALLKNPFAAVRNMELLTKLGARNQYGFFEAVDYTRERLPSSAPYKIIQSYMAHHQGMSLLALHYFFTNGKMQKRFHEVPEIQKVELLLQERVPPYGRILKEREICAPEVRNYKMPHLKASRMIDDFTYSNQVQWLSNREYSVFLSARGSGYSHCFGQRMNRYREDAAQDTKGIYCYISDTQTGAVFTPTPMPIWDDTKETKVRFDLDRAVFTARKNDIEAVMEVAVCPEDPVEIRKITLANHGKFDAVLDLTSYLEVSLSECSQDETHPAFRNLFIQTEYNLEKNYLLAKRRARSENDVEMYAVHTVAVEDERIGSISYETDRTKFIGRGRDTHNPKAIEMGQPLSATIGTVLEPCMALRCRVKVKSGENTVVSFAVGAAKNHHDADIIGERYSNPSAVARALEMAWTYAQAQVQYLGIRPTQIKLYQRIASHLSFMTPIRIKQVNDIAQNRAGRNTLWSMGISGDYPILLLRIEKGNHISVVREVMKAHEFCRMRGLMFDLVILNESTYDYIQPLQEQLYDIIRTQNIFENCGSIILKQRTLLESFQINFLLAVAHLVIDADEDLKNQLFMGDYPKVSTKPLLKPKNVPSPVKQNAQSLLFFNGMGGFSKEGHEYVIKMKPGEASPAPWCNILTNDSFGCLLSETGAGYTWSENCREMRITPWLNDATSNPHTEAIYIRDNDRHLLWNPTPGPVAGNSDYTVRHGRGYSIFENGAYGLQQELTYTVLHDSALRIARLKLKNELSEERNLTLTWYVNLCLGVNKHTKASLTHTWVDTENQVICARNPWFELYERQIIFFAVPGQKVRYLRDQRMFFGSGGLTAPVGAQYDFPGFAHSTDPCAALQFDIVVRPNSEITLNFLMGRAESLAQMEDMMEDASTIERANDKIQQTWDAWDHKLSKIQISTPNQALNVLFNGFMMYQVLASRVLARTGFYQSGGAYGFRDQLQDMMAVIYCEPSRVREYMIECARHQFLHGDVQHWWHPPFHGVRTRTSDDRLFLPYVLADYIQKTGDESILHVKIPYLEDIMFPENATDVYVSANVSDVEESLYLHAIRAIDVSLSLGEHGLPLMGSGDWNDAMNKVGPEGKGESVWLGFFLVRVLADFIPICKRMEDETRAKQYEEVKQKLQENLELHGWDGNWYRRAYFDDGTPLGSTENDEGRIDSLSQSWAVLSGADKERCEKAMQAAKEQLWIKEEGLFKLLTPPFEHSKLEPGYIKGYVAGVRENGGQYTHAAAWFILAQCKMGKGNEALELFDMLNPIRHGETPAQIARYKVEPYVYAADVYAVPPHTGRGGWTWYTGSVSWMYKVLLEAILGFEKKEGKIFISPCIPDTWSHYEIIYHIGDTKYHIAVQNPGKIQTGHISLSVDGRKLSENAFTPIDDGKEHFVTAVLQEKEMAES